jgi:hypothetical protein
VQIEYDEGGKLKDMLKDKNWTIRKTMDATNADVVDITTRLNQKITHDGSHAKISNLSVLYQAELRGQSNTASIDYTITATGTLSDYIISRDSSGVVIVDMGWRDISLDGPVLIDGYDINLPISAIKEKEPEAYLIMKSFPKVADLLSKSIMDAQKIKNIPLTQWHFLFDPTGINSDGSIAITEYSLNTYRSQNENSVKSAVSESFMADTDYEIGIIQPEDSGNIRIVGFARIDVVDGIEILGVTHKPPQGFAVTTTENAPFELVYGLPITIVVAAAIIGYFLFKKGTTFFSVI